MIRTFSVPEEIPVNIPYGITCIHFECEEDLSGHIDSRLFPKGTMIAHGEFMVDGEKEEISLQVEGDMFILFKGDVCTKTEELPQALKNRINRYPDDWHNLQDQDYKNPKYKWEWTRFGTVCTNFDIWIYETPLYRFWYRHRATHKGNQNALGLEERNTGTLAGCTPKEILETMLDMIQDRKKRWRTQKPAKPIPQSIQMIAGAILGLAAGAAGMYLGIGQVF